MSTSFFVFFFISVSYFIKMSYIFCSFRYIFFIFIAFFSFGDYAPKTYLGRVASIAWMIVSLITLSLFTAAIIASLTSVDGADKAQIYGREVMFNIPIWGF